MARILLSHATDDRPRVRRLAEGLRRAGYAPWLIEDEVRIGRSVREVIESGARDSDFVVACLSRQALHSGWLEAELRLVLDALPPERASRLILLRFEDVEVPPGLQGRSAVYVREEHWDAGIAELESVLRRLENEQTPPADSQLPAELSACSEPALQLMRAAAPFAPAPIPEDWLVTTAGLEKGSREAEEGLTELANRALVQRDVQRKEVTPVPSLVEQLRAYLAPGARQHLLNLALVSITQWVWTLTDPLRPEVASKFERWRPHLEALLRVTPPATDSSLWSVLALMVGNILFARGEDAQGGVLLKQALATVDEEGRAELVSEVLDKVSSQLRERDPAAAKQAAQRAVELSGSAPGVSDESKARLVQGRLGEAKALFEQAKDLMESRYGPDCSELGATLNNLGLTLFRMGDRQGARACYERAARLFERSRGPDHPSVAASRAGLLQTLKPGSREARRELDRIVSTGLTLYQPKRAAGEEQLQKAVVLARSKQIAPAEVASALSEALRTAEEGGSPENAARAALLLGAVLGSQGAWESAQGHIEHALQLARQADEPMLVAEAYRLLGDASLHGSYYEDARLNYAEAIRRYDALGFKSKAARTRMLLLTMLLQLGRTAESDSLLPPLQEALDEGLFTDAQERADAEQALQLARSLRGLAHKGETP